MIIYLLASLPTPRLDTEPSPSPAAWVAACRDLLGPAEVADLSWAAGLAPTARPETETGRHWADVDNQLRDAITRVRAERLQQDPAPWLLNPTGYRADIPARVAAAFTLPNPAEREWALLKLRWALAEDLARSQPDGFPALLARAVQSSLAARAAGWQSEPGARVFEALLGAMLEPWGASA